MATTAQNAAAKKSRPARMPTLKQLVVRTQKIQTEVNDLLALLRRLDRDKVVLMKVQSGLPKSIKPL